jgi:hypothetical protein
MGIVVELLITKEENVVLGEPLMEEWSKLSEVHPAQVEPSNLRTDRPGSG